MRWTVAVRSATSPPPGSPILAARKIPEDILGGQDDLSKIIRKVTFKLHDSYANHLRVVDRPPFEISETGWGEFAILIKIFFVTEAGGEKPLQIQHLLKLHSFVEPVPPTHGPWLEQTPDDLLRAAAETVEQVRTPMPSSSAPKEPETPGLDESPSTPAVHSWQYDEIVFTEPTEALYRKLLESPPTPLPAINRFGSQFVKQIGSKGESGEFTLDIEYRELKKLNWANLKVLIEIERLRGKLIRDERELAELKRDNH